MKRIAITAVMAIVVLSLSLVIYKRYLDKPEEMHPLPAFAQLCQAQENDGHAISNRARYVSVQSAGSVALNDVWEKHLSVARWSEDARQLYDLSQSAYVLEASHASGLKRTQFGFVDHIDSSGVKLKFRIRAELPGGWRYLITGPKGEVLEQGEFEVLRAKPVFPEQLALDPVYPGKLVANGKPFHWIGGKWIAAQNYVPCYIPQMRFLRDSHQPVSDQQYTDYLDYLLETKHNALLIKMAQFALMSDGYTWDVDWIARADWMVREALKRGLYVQINLFDTWSRDARYKVLNNTSGEQQVFNAWEPAQDDYPKVKSYLRTLAARFSAYPNVVWELGNEMEHYPNCGECFVKQANAHYLPWLEEADPYDHMVGLSEGGWLNANVDLGFLHQTRTKDFDSLPEDRRPMVMNELVFSDDTDALWKDSTMRDESARFAFRRTFWRNLMTGTTGSFEATWLNISMELGLEVKAVMEDHAILAEFVDYLGADLNRRAVAKQTRSDIPGVLSYSFDIADRRYTYLMLAYYPGDEISIEPEYVFEHGDVGEEGSLHYRILDVTTGQWSVIEPAHASGKKDFVLNAQTPDMLFEISTGKSSGADSPTQH